MDSGGKVIILRRRKSEEAYHASLSGAACRSQERGKDAARDLTEKGRMDIESVAHHLKRLNVQVRQIFHSGKTRAQSTARVLAKHLQPPAGISEAQALAPLDDPEIWADRIAKMDEDTLLAGHLPHLANLAALLITGNKETV